MKIIQQYLNINPNIRSIVFIVLLIFSGIILGQIISYVSSPYLLENIEGPKYHHYSPFYLTDDQKQQIINGYTNVSMILCSEITLLIGLIYVYIQTYRKTKSRYVIGFILFVGVFFMKSVSHFLSMALIFSEPIRQAPVAIEPLLTGFYGPFGIYFTFFEILAICILIFISRE